MINKSLLLVLISGVCAGSGYPLIKIAETHNIPGFSYIFWVSIIVVLTLGLLTIINKQKLHFYKKDIPYYLFCAATNIIIPQILFFLIAPNVATNILSLIIVLTPIFVYMASIVFLKETLKIDKGLGIVLSLAGIILLFIPDIMNTSASSNFYWLALALLLPLNYTFNRIVASKLLPDDNGTYTLTVGLFSCVAFISLIVMILSKQFYIPWRELNHGDLALILHAIFMVIFYVIFFMLARQNALKNSLSFYIAPLIGMVWGYFLFNEAFTLIFALSSILVFWGLYLVTKK